MVHCPKQIPSQLESSNSAPEHAIDKIQKLVEHEKKLRFTHSRIFNFTFIIELWQKLFLSKHKSYNYAALQKV